MAIKTDCYLALLKKYQEKYPNAHFEVITSRSSSPLKPSKKLLIDSGYMKPRDKKVKENGRITIIKGKKKKLIPFKEYEKLLTKELMENPKAIKRMKELLEISKERDVYLICYEKNALECHRTIVKNLILSL
jgi:uncharacterized protein (DUF488 family)